MIDSLDQRNRFSFGEITTLLGAVALAVLAALWLLGAVFGAWLAYDQCNLPNDNGVVCDKTLDYRLRIYQPLLALAGSLAALTVSWRLVTRPTSERLTSLLSAPAFLTTLFFALWLTTLLVT